MSIGDHLCLTEHQHNFSPLGVYHQENTRLPASMCISAYSFIYSSSTFFMYCCSFSLWVWLYIHGYVHAGDTHVCSGVCIHMESRGKPQVWFFGCHPTFLFYLYSLSLAQVWWNRNITGSLDIDPQGSSSFYFSWWWSQAHVTPTHIRYVNSGDQKQVVMLAQPALSQPSDPPSLSFHTYFITMSLVSRVVRIMLPLSSSLWAS